MRPVFVDAHRVRDAGAHFDAPTGDLHIPCFYGAGIGSCVEAADQFQRQSGTIEPGTTDSYAALTLFVLPIIDSLGRRPCTRSCACLFDDEGPYFA